jgi:Right handed beta helix region
MGNMRCALARRRHLPALLLSLACPVDARAATWVVQPSGDGDFPNVQAAADGSISGDTIILGPGTFTGAGNRGVVVSGKDLTFGSLSGVDATDIDCEQADRALVVSSGFVTVSGITFRNGDPASAGGAIRALNAALVVTDCAFRQNSGTGDVFDAGGGGALHVTGGRIAVTRCVFDRNHAGSPDGIGGAIAVFAGGNAVVTESTFEGNDTGDGQFAGGAGIVSWAAGDLVIDRCTFTDNVSRDGVAIFLYATKVKVEGCGFTGNEGRYVAEAISNQVIDFSACTFTDNPSTALIVLTDTAVTDCTFLRNVTPFQGGGVRVSGSRATFTGTTFAANRAGEVGGAVCVLGGLPTDFDRCTFVDNEAPMGGSIHSRYAPVSMKRCILFGGTGGAATCEGGGTITVRCCDVFGNEGGDYVGCLVGRNGVDRNFGEDPAFCDPDAGDYALHEGSRFAPPGLGGCGRIGAYPVGCGTTSLARATWGEIKSWYRE